MPWCFVWSLCGLSAVLAGCADNGQGEPTLLEATARAAIRVLKPEGAEAGRPAKPPQTSDDAERAAALAAKRTGHTGWSAGQRKQSVPVGDPEAAQTDEAPGGDPVRGDRLEGDAVGSDALEGDADELADDTPVPSDEDDVEALDDDADDTDDASEFQPVEDAVVLTQARAQGVQTPEGDRFFDVEDGPIRARLAVLPIAKVKRGRGGRSLGFKIKLSDGTKGYFKAEQTFSAANWNSEVAAYHLDRMLGFHRVPPVISRRMPWEPLAEAAGGDKRRREIIVRKDGTVRGGFVWWIPDGLRTWPDLPGWEKWIRVRGWPSTTVTPLQRPAKWAHELRLRREHGDEWLSPQERHRRRNFDPTPDRPDRPQELSDLIVFDYLTKNVDRWGGGNANVLIRNRGGPLVFLDNGAGFAPGRARPSLIESRLHVLQRFRRSTVRALKSFDIGEFKERLDAEPLAPILHTREFRHLKERRNALLEWIRRMERRYGERATPWE